MSNYSIPRLISEALTAVVTGIVTPYLMQAVGAVYNALGVPPIFYVFIAAVSLLEFFSGMIEAYIFGFIYCISLIFFGVLIGEWGSVITGAISMAALIAGIYIRNQS